jgi:hypothetical protein
MVFEASAEAAKRVKASTVWAWMEIYRNNKFISLKKGECRFHEQETERQCRWMHTKIRQLPSPQNAVPIMGTIQ